ncbi:cystathionine beta-lyase [Fusarium beomiforme]|uniref:Cystathionine beta-lyase n=1 Tax=Fusarium beomiforme TaxID=44412 RepID=A0A9P5DW64_9HYPO|nr:cystathionine beta-lyase [Fusarium beomiforme]
MRAELGSSLPPDDKHAISVYIPAWKDTIAWGKGDLELLGDLETVYPRYFISRAVNRLGQLIVEWTISTFIHTASETFKAHFCTVVSSPVTAIAIATRSQAIRFQQSFRGPFTGHVFVYKADIYGGVHHLRESRTSCNWDEVYVVVYSYPLDHLAKAFWRHTGFGISSRRAKYWLDNAPFLNQGHEPLAVDLPLREAQDAKIALRLRIADLYSTQGNELDISDVLLYPTGMSAICQTQDILWEYRQPGKATIAIVGFMKDTFKALSKTYGQECRLYGSSPSDLDVLERDLRLGLDLCALYTEFPGNPLLESVDLERLQNLSIDYDFLFVVDDTVGTPVNVDLMSYCDVVCTSLTTMFSGRCNVMGGSTAINPAGRNHFDLKESFREWYIDTYFPLDAIVMEKNSADFEERVIKASQNAECVADILRKHNSVEQVYYPKGSTTQHIYEQYKRPGKGYGYLLSIRFKSSEAAIAFHDAIDLAKGPGAGANFTLCCAYTLLAHYNDIDWAEEYGVVKDLVRISVGTENDKFLEVVINAALDAALHAHENLKEGCDLSSLF